MHLLLSHNASEPLTLERCDKKSATPWHSTEILWVYPWLFCDSVTKPPFFHPEKSSSYLNLCRERKPEHSLHSLSAVHHLEMAGGATLQWSATGYSSATTGPKSQLCAIYNWTIRHCISSIASMYFTASTKTDLSKQMTFWLMFLVNSYFAKGYHDCFGTG